jgi:hypothetical protein
VRNEKLPHFMRFNAMQSILLDICIMLGARPKSARGKKRASGSERARAEHTAGVIRIKRVVWRDARAFHAVCRWADHPVPPLRDGLLLDRCARTWAFICALCRAHPLVFSSAAAAPSCCARACAGAFCNGLVFLTGFASVAYCFYYTLQARARAPGAPGTACSGRRKKAQMRRRCHAPAPAAASAPTLEAHAPCLSLSLRASMRTSRRCLRRCMCKCGEAGARRHSAAGAWVCVCAMSER